METKLINSALKWQKIPLECKNLMNDGGMIIVVTHMGIDNLFRCVWDKSFVPTFGLALTIPTHNPKFGPQW